MEKGRNEAMPELEIEGDLRQRRAGDLGVSLKEEKNQEESSEGGGRPGNVRELAGCRNGSSGRGLAEKSVITQEVWNSDLRPRGGADATMVKM